MFGPGLSSALSVVLLAAAGIRPLETALEPRASGPAASAAVLIASGDRLFRDARFEEAQAAYAQALELDGSSLRGHLAMGKVAIVLSDSKLAAAQYSAAYQLAPHDPEAILALAEVVTSADARTTLWRNFLALNTGGNTPRAEDIRSRLTLAGLISDRREAANHERGAAVSIPLLPLGSQGVALRARVDSGPELNLVVDTGASGLVLKAEAAARSGFESLGSAALCGYGAEAPAAGRFGRIRSFETSGIRLADLPVTVIDTPPEASPMRTRVDGWIGLDTFQDYLIRLDGPHRTLTLTPFDSLDAHCGDCVRAYRLGALLAIRVRVAGHREGAFLIDSGSVWTIVSSQLAPAGGRPVLLRGAQGGQTGMVPSTPLALRVGERSFYGFEYATIDTAAISSRNGVAIAGAVGYSMLHNIELTLDYKHGLAAFGNSRSRQ